MKKKILSCVFKLETNRFISGKTDQKRFRERIYEVGGPAVRARFHGAASEVAAFCEVIDPLDDYEYEPVFALEAQPGGEVSRDVYDFAVNEMVQAIRRCREEAVTHGEAPESAPSALLLALHGAMVAEGHEDADGDFLETLRREVGPNCPIFVTLDLHVNLSKKMVDSADMLLPCRCYPHTDYYENGLQTAKCLMDTLSGKVHPVMRVKSLPMLFPYTPTTHEIFRKYDDCILKLNALPGVLGFRFSHGFFASDVTEGGPAAIAVTDGDPERAEKLAADFADEIYRNKESFYRSYYTAEGAVAEAKKLLSENVKPPIVIADVADNPGSGASSDSVALLRALVDADVEALYALIYDTETEKQAEEAGVGAKISVKLGGKIAPECTGGPFETEAAVLALGNGEYIQEGPFMHGLLQKMGPCALLGIGKVKVIVNSYKIQPSDRAAFHHFGLSPETAPIVAVKSAVHFRASYEPVAGAILEAEAPALAPMDPKSLSFRFAPKSFYPLSED